MAQALTSGEISAASFVGVLGDEKEQGAPVDSGLADEVWGARFNTAILQHRPAPQRRPGARQLHHHRSPARRRSPTKRPPCSPTSRARSRTVDKVRGQDLAVLTPEFVAEYQAKWNGLFK